MTDASTVLEEKSSDKQPESSTMDISTDGNETEKKETFITEVFVNALNLSPTVIIFCISCSMYFQSQNQAPQQGVTPSIEVKRVIAAGNSLQLFCRDL